VTENGRERRREMGNTGLYCHPIGFGCYRVTPGNPSHEAALRRYLDRGGNLIDTSANYGDGKSEALVGEVLKNYERSRVIVVTKGGYIQGSNMEAARERDLPEVVRYAEGVWHCVHPAFLEIQLASSLERLGLEVIDVYLLHNPEYFLMDKARDGSVIPQEEEEYYRRIRQAFQFLEKQVENGKVSWYGISSNTFGLPADDPTRTSLERCLEVARSLRSDHHFRVVQLPLNLFEPGGALEKNNGGRTVLDFSRDEGLAVLSNRPLNAFAAGRMIRLADFVPPGEPRPAPDALAAILSPMREHEKQIARELQIGLCSGGLGVAGVVEKLVPQLESSIHWEGLAGHYVLPPLQAWLQENQQRFAGDPRWQAWVQGLIDLLDDLLDAVARHLSWRDQAISTALRGRLYSAGYPEGSESLSRMAINVLAGLPGLSCILTGMRRTKYVNDAMGATELPSVDALRILQNFNQPKEEGA
jgi:aryl-alcohol dehydrogenase-like predicted oxidoreductase